MNIGKINQFQENLKKPKYPAKKKNLLLLLFSYQVNSAWL
jgi:hypothetical protein